jgi:glycosyltransferase involved in cell wall biosynthesis
MKVLHFILGKANKDRANGVNQVIAGLAKYSALSGAEVRVIGKAESVVYEGEIIDRDSFAVEVYSSWGKPLKRALKDALLWADVVHLHGVYSPWNVLVSRMCAKHNRPYVVTLHDGLAPERALSRTKFKKKIFHAIFQRMYLEKAAGIHVLTPEEATDLLKVAQPENVFCIPNGIDLNDYPSIVKQNNRTPNKISIGYLGRLSPEKNLEALCEAFTNININGDFLLKLAGPQSTYGEGLLNRFAEHGVEWVGPKFGSDKSEFISSVGLFVHPSLCDVFSIAAMEVLAIGTPLLITRTSKASYFYNRGAFFMCEPTSFGLENGLRDALNQCEVWAEMSANGRRLIEDRLNWRAAAHDMLAAYNQILAGQ